MLGVNLAAIFFASVASMAVGALWYSPLLFGRTWRSLTGLAGSKLKDGQVKSMLTMLTLAFTEIFTLAHFTVFSSFFYPEYSAITIGLITSLMVWVGFVFPVMASAYVFAERRKKLLAIDAGYHLIILIFAGILLAVFG